MMRKLFFLLIAILVFLLAAGVTVSFVLGGRVERRVMENARDYGSYSVVRAAPLRGWVIVKPFAWNDPEQGLGLKASSLTVRMSAWEMAGVLLGLRDAAFHELSIELDRAILTLPSSFGAPETIHATSVSSTLRGLFNLLPDRSSRFLGDLSGIQAVLDYVNVPDLARFDELTLVADTSRSGTNVHIHARSGAGSIPVAPLMIYLSPGDELDLELTWDTAPTGAYTGTLRADMRDVRILPDDRLTRELDARREGLSNVLPADGLYLDRLFLDSETADGEIAVTRFEFLGPDIEARGRGTIGLSDRLVPVRVEGRADVQLHGETLRPAVVSLLYYVTSGDVPPRDGLFTLWIEPTPGTDRGWAVRITPE